FGRAQHDYSNHSEERAEKKRELNVNDDELETTRQQKEIHDQQLNEGSVRRDAPGVFAAEKSQEPMVFTHRHGDARSNPSHGTDGGNQPETNHRADNATAVLPEK